VDTLLGHGVISGPANVCVGSFISLSESISGGLWLDGSTGIANVDPSGNVTGISSGVAIISYYFSNACGASMATYSVTVTPGASAISGGDSVGIGANLTLGNAATGGAWSSTNAAIAVINPASGFVTGVAAGVDTIMYTVTNICGTTTAMLTLHVGPAPYNGPVIGLDSVCVGSNISLSDSIAGGAWTASNGHATVTSSGVVTGVTTGLDTIYYSVHTGFGTTVMSKIIFVNHLPVLRILGPNVVALGGDYYFYGIPAGGTLTASNPNMGAFVSYYNTVLYSGTDSVTTASVGSFVVVNNGGDTIHYRLTNSCGTTDSTFIIRLGVTGVGAIAGTNSALNVYPNPNQGEFTMNLLSANTEDAQVVITNIVGMKVKEFTTSTNKPTNIKLDQPAGLYFVAATTVNGRYTTKITITQ
jgi:hypothetical protein